MTDKKDSPNICMQFLLKEIHMNYPLSSGHKIAILLAEQMLTHADITFTNPKFAGKDIDEFCTFIKKLMDLQIKKDKSIS